MSNKKQSRSDRVVFHEYGREYIWDIPSGAVMNRKGETISFGCPTLAVARKKARGFRK